MPVFVLVMTVAIYSVVRFRAKPGDMRDGAPIHGNTRLEVVWVTIPFLMVTALAIYGWVVLDDLEAKQPNTLVVNVTGQQFTWSFDYPSEKVEVQPRWCCPRTAPSSSASTRRTCSTRSGSPSSGSSRTPCPASPPRSA